MAILEEVVDDVRERLGNVEDAKLPGDQIERAIESGLREFARYLPIRRQTEITLVKDQYEYEVPEGAIGVYKFDVKHATINTTDPFQLSFEGEYAFPSFDEFLDQMVDEAQVVQTSTVPTLILSPELVFGVPRFSDSYRLFVTLEYARSLDQLSDREVESMVNYVLGDCLMYLSNRRSKAVVRIPTATGYLTLDQGETFRTKAQYFFKEFRCRMGEKAHTMVMG